MMSKIHRLSCLSATVDLARTSSDNDGWRPLTHTISFRACSTTRPYPFSKGRRRSLSRVSGKETTWQSIRGGISAQLMAKRHQLPFSPPPQSLNPSMSRYTGNPPSAVIPDSPLTH